MPAVIISGLVFGLGFGVFAIFTSVLTADLVFGLTATQFFTTEWSSVALLGLFAVLGAAFTYLFAAFLRIAREERGLTDIYG
jgi:hypothetical protein